MPNELFYEERVVNESPSGIEDFIDAGTLTIAAGPIVFQFFCPKVTFFGTGTIDCQFKVISSALGLTLELSTLHYSNLFTADCHIGVYAEHQEDIVADGDYDFKVQVSGANYVAACDSPRVPAWFRILSDPFSDASAVLASISHKFGLTHT